MKRPLIKAELGASDAIQTARKSSKRIHSPRTPSVAEMVKLIEKAVERLPRERLWVNPDCGLKTRNWEETRVALAKMVAATIELRKNYAQAKA